RHCFRLFLTMRVVADQACKYSPRLSAKIATAARNKGASGFEFVIPRRRGGNDASHSVPHRARIGVLEVAVARERPQREEFRVAVITQVEHAREARRRVARLVPETVVALRACQIVDPALDRGMVDLSCRHQAEQRPSGLRRRTWCPLIAAI